MKALAIDYTDQKSKHKFHLPLSVFKSQKMIMSIQILKKSEGKEQ